MFVCCYCEKQIQGLSVVVDETHVAHYDCAKRFEFLKKELADKEAINDAIRNGDSVEQVAKERGIKLIQLI